MEGGKGGGGGGGGRRSKRREDFTGGYDKMPRWTYGMLGGMRLQSFLLCLPMQCRVPQLIYTNKTGDCCCFFYLSIYLFICSSMDGQRMSIRMSIRRSLEYPILLFSEHCQNATSPLKHKCHGQLGDNLHAEISRDLHRHSIQSRGARAFVWRLTRPLIVHVMLRCSEFERIIF